MKERITKKDLGYWILILIGIIVTILTIKLADNATAVDYIGFAGTITSILLAVVALMYSFYQNNAYESTTQQLESSSKKIKKAVKELNQVSELKEIVNEVRKESSNISTSIKDLHGMIGTVESGIDKVNSNLEDTKQNIFDTLILQSESTNTERDFTNVEQLVGGLNRIPFSTLYLCYKLHEKNIKVNSMEFCTFFQDSIFYVNEEDKKDTVTMREKLNGLLIGILFMYGQFGFFKHKVSPEVQITQFNKSVINEIKKKRDQMLQSSNEKDKQGINNIDAFISENV